MGKNEFINRIWQHYRRYGRDLPWRKHINPYRILVSEIMLQQTQVARVAPKYKEFLRKFPSAKALAQTSNAEVLRAWSGLGYNRRALYLKKAAEKIVSEYGNKLPSTLEDLTNLPGVGKNTAGAIAAYAFNQPAVFIETNIRKVFLHHFFLKKKNVSDNQLLPLIEKTLAHKHPREWYWALMDYGSYLASCVSNPNRKSRHYMKQSKFEGSVRQVRGKVLKLLLEHKHLSEKQMKEKIADGRLGLVLHRLIVEGFVYKKRGLYSLGG